MAAIRHVWLWVTAAEDPPVARAAWRLMVVLLVLGVVLYGAL